MSLLDDFLEAQREFDPQAMAGVIAFDLVDYLRTVGQEGLADALEGEGLQQRGWGGCPLRHVHPPIKPNGITYTP